MKTHALPLSALVLAVAALPLGAQTNTVHHTAVHHATEHRTTMGGGCVKLPELSPKIPALPTNAPCARALYTLTHTPDTHLDYASPLVSPELRAQLSGEKTTYSLVYIDTEIGTGPLAQPGKFYTVHYTGYLTDGTKFDSSVDRGKPITFPYGKHRVIEGWDTAFEGMHVGGKRRLYIPYQLAYGEAGRPPIIPAKAELVFDIEFIAQGDQMPNEHPIEPMHRPEPMHSEPMHPAPTPAAKPATAPPASQPQPAAKPATQPQQ